MAPEPSRSRWAPLVALLLLSAAASQAAAACPKKVGNSLRVMTLNTALTVYQPDIANNPADDVFGMDNEKRAKLLAEHIKRHDPDVVVMTEVFDVDAADTLVDELKGRYPSRVEQIDDEWDSRLQDSGLMLFSRYPFTRFADEQGDPDDAEGIETDGRAWVWVDGEEKDDDEAFVHRAIFEYRVSDDHWSEKGVGLVKFTQGCSDGRYRVAVAFSHTQTGYVNESLADFHEQNWSRIKNLRAIKWLIEDGLSASRRTEDWLIVAGDLNVNGNPQTFDDAPFFPYVEAFFLSGEDGGEIGGDVYDSGAEGEPHSQWHHVFENVGTAWEDDDTQLKSFYSRGSSIVGTSSYDPGAEEGALLIDAWGFETSPADLGVTSSGEVFGGPWLDTPAGKGERLDYILHNKPTDAERGELCMQYIYRAVDFANGPNGYLTDHAPLVADFNLPAPRCSITAAGGNGVHDVQPVVFDPTDTENLRRVFDGFDGEYCTGPDADHLTCAADAKGSDTRLKFGGSMQWYKLDTTPSGQAISLEVKVTRRNCDPTDDNAVDGCVAFALYHESDLSTELDPAEGKCKLEPVNERIEDWKCKYFLDKPPYYARVFFSAAQDDNLLKRPEDGQKYEIAFRRYACKNEEDACFLPKHREVTQWWPPSPLDPNPSDCDTDGDGDVTPQEDGECRNTMWFRLTHENAGDMPRSPELVWTSTDNGFTSGDDPVHGTIVDAATLQPVALDDVGVTVDGSAVTRGVRPADANGLPGLIEDDEDIWEKPYYLKLTRYGVDAADPDKYINLKFPTAVVFKTDLTYHIPHTIHCIEERTDVGDDDLWQRVTAGSCHPGGSGCFRLGLFDSPCNVGGTVVSNPRHYPLYRKYATNADFSFFEDVDDDEALVLARLDVSCPGCAAIGFDATSWQVPDDEEPGGLAVSKVAFQDTQDADDREYRYDYSFYRSKKPETCAGKAKGQLGLDPKPCPGSLECSKQGYCCATVDGVCPDY